MRRLYLHVGIHRTATTSTQRSLRQGFEALLGQGYLYPFGVARHNALISQLRYGLRDVEDLGRDLARRMEARGAHSAILSDEDMSRIEDFSLFAPLKAQFDVKVVVQLRRQDLWLESWYLQNVKWQWDPALAHLSLEDFLAERAQFFWIDYAQRLAHYEDVLGQGSVLAGVFEQAEMPQGPVAAVLRLMGITDPDLLAADQRRNPSFSPRISEFMRHLPLDELDTKERVIFERAVARMDADLPVDSRLMLDPATRRDLLAEYEGSNRQTARRWFGRDHLFGEPLPPADAPLARRVLPEGSEGLLQDYVAPLVLALGRVLAEARQQEDTAPAPDSQHGGRRQGAKKDRVRPRT